MSQRLDPESMKIYSFFFEPDSLKGIIGVDLENVTSDLAQ